jgi:hypothetical protein
VAGGIGRTDKNLDRLVAAMRKTGTSGGKLLSKTEVKALFTAARKDNVVSRDERGTLAALLGKGDAFSYGSALEFGARANVLEIGEASTPAKKLTGDASAVYKAFKAKWKLHSQGVTIDVDAVKAALKVATANGKVSDAERYGLADTLMLFDEDVKYTVAARRLLDETAKKYKLTPIFR